MRCSMPTETADALCRIYLQPEPLGQLARARNLRSVVDQPMATDFHAEKDVVGDRERGNQFEMLMHHAEAGFDRDGWIGDPRSRTVQSN